MTLRWVATAALAGALLTGCSSAPPRWSRASTSAPDPDRWERAACHLDEYPAELDGRALARARFEDLRASRSGSSSSFAAARLQSERRAFDARCAAWRAASVTSGSPFGMRYAGSPHGMSPPAASGEDHLGAQDF